MTCHEHCDRDAGCAGSLPFLDRNDGCRDCSLVQLTRSGRQVCPAYKFNDNDFYLFCRIFVYQMCVTLATIEQF